MTGYRPMTLADLASHLVRTADSKTRWKLVWEFLEEYLPRACGSRGLPFFSGAVACDFLLRRFCAGALMTSSGVRGTGTAS